METLHNKYVFCLFIMSGLLSIICKFVIKFSYHKCFLSPFLISQGELVPPCVIPGGSPCGFGHSSGASGTWRQCQPAAGGKSGSGVPKIYFVRNRFFFKIILSVKVCKNNSFYFATKEQSILSKSKSPFSISQNVRLSVRLCVCLSVHF